MINQDVKYKSGNKTVESGYVEKPFDEAKAELENAGYEIISLEQFAKLRIKQGKDSHVANYRAYTREGFLYLPKNREVRLTKKSPIMANAKEATKCHRKRKEFYLTDNQVEESLEDSVQVKVKHGETIPTKRFGENELTAYAFGKTAGKYGEFLKDAGIKEISVYLDDIKEKPFARQAWLHGLSGCSRSLLSGDGNLDCDYTVRGVRNTSAEGASASKISEKEVYTPAQIAKVLKTLKIGGLESQILDGLREK